MGHTNVIVSLTQNAALPPTAAPLTLSDAHITLSGVLEYKIGDTTASSSPTSSLVVQRVQLIEPRLGARRWWTRRRGVHGRTWRASTTGHLWRLRLLPTLLSLPQSCSLPFLFQLVGTLQGQPLLLRILLRL